MAEPSPTLFGMPSERGRWVFVLLGLVINLAIGSIYAWSVFRKPLETFFAVGATESLLPFIASFSSFMLTRRPAAYILEHFFGFCDAFGIFTVDGFHQPLGQSEFCSQSCTSHDVRVRGFSSCSYVGCEDSLAKVLIFNG